MFDSHPPIPTACCSFHPMADAIQRVLGGEMQFFLLFAQIVWESSTQCADRSRLVGRGSFLTSPVLAHHTGVLQGYWSTSGWSSLPTISSMASPSKFNPRPHEQGQHRCRAKKCNGSRCLNPLSEMAKIPCSCSTSSDNKPQAVPCRRIGVHALRSSRVPSRYCWP